MNILGISCYYHESAAALIKDGVIVAASEEERFSRKKHDASFPKQAIVYCLKEGNIRGKDIDYVVFYEKPIIKFERLVSTAIQYYPYSRSQFVDGVRRSLSSNLWIQSAIMNALGVPKERIVFVPHHLSHAAASYFPSPFSSAAFVTFDAVGEWTTTSWGIASGHELFPQKELRFPHSIGLLYSAFTAFLGFEVNDGEYKVMGMAAYGTPRYEKRIRRIVKQFADGSISLDESYISFHTSSTRMYTKKFEQVFADCSKFDLAASIQSVTADLLCTMISRIRKETGETNLVIGGGVALNSVINGLIPKKTGFRRVFIFPAAGDDGAAVGAALYMYHHVLGHTKRHGLPHVFLGPRYTKTEIFSFLRERHIRHRRVSDRELIHSISRELSKGKVVGWFEGRSEFGPRALGHRSILADPRKSEMKNIVNVRIKYREEFRPFAPAILSRFAARYFKVTSRDLSSYMLSTIRANRIAIRKAPAVIHVDKTSRIQSVDPDTYVGNFGRVLESFYKKTGVPMLLNTSFNLKGEPIVQSPEDAYKTFLRSGIDILVLENCIVEK